MTPVHRVRIRSALAACGVAVLVAGCSSGVGVEGADGSSETGGGSASTLARPAVPTLPAPSRAGSGTVVVGGTTGSFTVTACRLEPDPADPLSARVVVSVTGVGTTSSGVAFTIEVQRFATGDEVVTFTDTVTYSDTARILQAQRIEVRGEVTDLRDPKAATSLVRTRRSGVTASGLASAPGDDADDGGLMGLALDASCEP